MDEKIKCPKCGGHDIVLTVQYRRCSILRIINALLIITIFLITIFNMAEIILYEALNEATQNIKQTSIPLFMTTGGYFTTADTYTAGPLIVIFIIVLAIGEISQHWIERKPRLYYICKDCKKIWYELEDEFFEEP